MTLDDAYARCGLSLMSPSGEGGGGRGGDRGKGGVGGGGESLCPSETRHPTREKRRVANSARWGWRGRKSQGCGQQGSEGDWRVPVGAWRDETGVSGAEEEGRKGGGGWG